MSGDNYGYHYQLHPDRPSSGGQVAAAGPALHIQLGRTSPGRYTRQGRGGIEIANDRRGTDPWHRRRECVMRHSRTTTDSSFLSLFVMTTAGSRNNTDGDIGGIGESGGESSDRTTSRWGGGRLLSSPFSVQEALGLLSIGVVSGGGPNPQPSPPSNGRNRDRNRNREPRSVVSEN